MSPIRYFIISTAIVVLIEWVHYWLIGPPFRLVFPLTAAAYTGVCCYSFVYGFIRWIPREIREAQLRISEGLCGFAITRSDMGGKVIISVTLSSPAHFLKFAEGLTTLLHKGWRAKP